MATAEEIYKALEGVNDPELGGNIVDLGMVTSVDVDERGVATIGIALTVAECPMRSQIENDTVRRIKNLPGITDVVVETPPSPLQRAFDEPEAALGERTPSRRTCPPTPGWWPSPPGRAASASPR